MDIEPYKAWIGREEVVEQPVTLFQAHAMEATLDRKPSLREGDPLPPLWHWAYFIDPHRQSEIAEDGHVARGGFVPPIPLPRRMFAGAQLSFPRPLLIGQTARRVSTIAGLTHKQGRTGELVFMKVHNEIIGPDGPCIIEDQDIVYREAPKPGATTSFLEPVRSAAWRESITPTEALLFRYSALIFNAHRIHFDRPYTEGHEGYAGLVVHGQLTATYLADLAMRNTRAGRMTGYSFRALRPIVDTGPFDICGAAEDGQAQLWAEAQGQLSLEASAKFEQDL